MMGFLLRCMSLLLALKRPSSRSPEGPVTEALRKRAGVVPGPPPMTQSGGKPALQGSRCLIMAEYQAGGPRRALRPPSAEGLPESAHAVP
jgi:hypothetical protein